jgi:hypothetical protein
MGARQYYPTLGRFTEVDPIEGGVDNDYNYPTDPLNSSDVSGKAAGDFYLIPDGRLHTIRNYYWAKLERFCQGGTHVNLGIEVLYRASTNSFRIWSMRLFLGYSTTRRWDISYILLRTGKNTVLEGLADSEGGSSYRLDPPGPLTRGRWSWVLDYFSGIPFVSPIIRFGYGQGAIGIEQVDDRGSCIGSWRFAIFKR